MASSYVVAIVIVDFSTVDCDVNEYELALRSFVSSVDVTFLVEAAVVVRVSLEIATSVTFINVDPDTSDGSLFSDDVTLGASRSVVRANSASA